MNRIVCADGASGLTIQVGHAYGMPKRPSGAAVRPELIRVASLRPAHVSGQLALDEPWLRERVRLWPIGAYAEGVLMRMPPPQAPITTPE